MSGDRRRNEFVSPRAFNLIVPHYLCFSSIKLCFTDIYYGSNTWHLTWPIFESKNTELFRNYIYLHSRAVSMLDRAMFFSLSVTWTIKICHLAALRDSIICDEFCNGQQDDRWFLRMRVCARFACYLIV